jgi:hypothetical protein
MLFRQMPIPPFFFATLSSLVWESQEGRIVPLDEPYISSFLGGPAKHWNLLFFMFFGFNLFPHFTVWLYFM